MITHTNCLQIQTWYVIAVVVRPLPLFFKAAQANWDGDDGGGGAN